MCISELLWAFSFWKSCKRLIGKKGRRQERKEGRKEEVEEARKQGKEKMKEGRGKAHPEKETLYNDLKYRTWKLSDFYALLPSHICIF